MVKANNAYTKSTKKKTARLLGTRLHARETIPGSSGAEPGSPLGQVLSVISYQATRNGFRTRMVTRG